MTPQKLRISVMDEDSETELGRGELEIRSEDKEDPEKFGVKTFVRLSQGGRVELQIIYTSPERRTREIFQACDPPKLLFGTLILWINWYSFNVGSTLGVSENRAELASRVAVVTTLGTAAGSLTAMMYSQYKTGYLMLEPLATGMLSSLVAICAPAAVITEAESVLIGTIGSLIGIAATEVETYLEIDDPCGAFPVHGASAVWGVISVGLFAEPEPCTGILEEKGLFKGGGFRLLGVQTLGAVTIAAWSGIMCFLTMWCMRFVSRKFHVLAFLALRPTKSREERGFDETEHAIHRENNTPSFVEQADKKLGSEIRWRKLEEAGSSFRDGGRSPSAFDSTGSVPITTTTRRLNGSGKDLTVDASVGNIRSLGSTPKHINGSSPSMGTVTDTLRGSQPHKPFLFKNVGSRGNTVVFSDV